MYEIDFEQYIKNGEPQKKEKSYAWATAIGLQQVDGLTPSKYLFQTALKNIEGDISIEEAKSLIDSYYESKNDRHEIDVQNEKDRTEEADKVSVQIAAILGEKSFTFSPSYLIAIHKRLFTGIYKFAGIIRDYDITKKEWVLNGDTVLYGASFEPKAALDYDFEQERNFTYKNLNKEQIVQHIALFISRLWQIHPFGEGNTRTTAVFTIKYLRYLGFYADNEIFAKNAWYFRNALVRANYKNVKKNIFETPDFLEAFLRNVLLDENNELKNRYCHVEYKKYAEKIPTVNTDSNANIPTVNSDTKITERQKQVIELIKKDNSISTQAVGKILGISRSSARDLFEALVKKNIIHRIGADKNGHWEVIEK